MFGTKHAADELAVHANSDSLSSAVQQVHLRQELSNAREAQTKQALRDQAKLPDVLIGLVRAYHCPELDDKTESLRGHTSRVLAVAVVGYQQVVSAVVTIPSSCGAFAVVVACKR